MALEIAMNWHWDGATEMGVANMGRTWNLLPFRGKVCCRFDGNLTASFAPLHTVDTGVQVYFCDPHSPWQRGSNENMNGLLRHYMPKGTDLSAISAADLAEIAASLNNRPRKTLGYMKPPERLTELVALTA